MAVKDWKGKRVIVIGAARQGIALARYLVLHGARVVLNDRRTADELKYARESLSSLLGENPGVDGSLRFAFGGHPLELLDQADCVCLSGGVSLQLPLVQEALARGISLSNDSQIFLEAAPCPVIGITGSAGKTTTTTLVGRMAQAAAKPGGKRNKEKMHPSSLRSTQGKLFSLHPSTKVWVGGNIGSPLISVAEEMQPEDLAVMELSSFQLEPMTRSPQVAAILNITPNHLDRHASMQEYTTAKARILDYQAPQDIAVLGRDDPGAWGLAEKAHGRLVSFGMERPAAGQVGTFYQDGSLHLQDGDSASFLMSRSSIGLRGEHNLLNVLAACAIAAAVGLPAEAMRAGVENFLGVPHRLELVRCWKDASWYNDSIATAPERTIAAIRSFSEALVLLAGGRDKNLPWDDFALLVRQRVDHLVLFGEAADKIYQAVDQAPEHPSRRPYTVDRCAGLQEAVMVAGRRAEAGDVVLLSPGGTSFDEFRDFEERGEAFQKWVMNLT